MDSKRLAEIRARVIMPNTDPWIATMQSQDDVLTLLADYERLLAVEAAARGRRAESHSKAWGYGMKGKTLRYVFAGVLGLVALAGGGWLVAKEVYRATRKPEWAEWASRRVTATPVADMEQAVLAAGRRYGTPQAHEGTYGDYERNEWGHPRIVDNTEREW